MWVCCSRKVLLGACACFSGKVQGFTCAWGIEILADHRVGEVPLQGYSRLMIYAHVLCFFLVVPEHGRLILARRCGVRALELHFPRAGVQVSVNKRLVVPGRKQCGILPPHPKSREVIVVYLRWVLQLIWAMKCQPPPFLSEPTGCWIPGLGLLPLGGRGRCADLQWESPKREVSHPTLHHMHQCFQILSSLRAPRSAFVRAWGPVRLGGGASGFPLNSWDWQEPSSGCAP